MKRTLISMLVMVILTACEGSQVIIQSTNTPVPSTATLAATQTPLPSPSPTPEPYLLEDGFLLDWDESAGDYVVAAEGIDSITTTADGEILALDRAGIPDHYRSPGPGPIHEYWFLLGSFLPTA